MKIIVLVDNREHPENISLEVEHGLSFYIETADAKVLLDVGASDKFFRNAVRLGIDIAAVDYLVLSHAHSDHTGGLACFLQQNQRAKIYLSSHVNASGYFSNRRGVMRDISIDYSLIQAHKERFIFLSDGIQLTPSLQIIGRIPVHHRLPQANRTLYAGSRADTFDHEIVLLFTQGGQTVLLSSCTHSGLLNTLKACRPALPSLFIGGLHLIDSDETNYYETEEELRALARHLLSEYPSLQIYTGHCTGNKVLALFSRIMPGKLYAFHTGMEVNRFFY